MNARQYVSGGVNQLIVLRVVVVFFLGGGGCEMQQACGSGERPALCGVIIMLHINCLTKLKGVISLKQTSKHQKVILTKNASDYFVLTTRTFSQHFSHTSLKQIWHQHFLALIFLFFDSIRL